MVFLSGLLASLKGFQWSMFITFFRFIVLFCAIIPIALRVNLDVSKTWFSYIISKDKSIPETIARNSTIPEELGRIAYVFSDKTGTLTKNEMIFKRISMENEQYSEDNFEELKNILTDECQACDAPLLDLYNILKYKQNELNDTNNNNNDLSNSVSSNDNIIDTNSVSSNDNNIINMIDSVQRYANPFIISTKQNENFLNKY